jgi:hypothetical protein
MVNVPVREDDDRAVASDVHLDTGRMDGDAPGRRAYGNGRNDRVGRPLDDRQRARNLVRA